MDSDRFDRRVRVSSTLGDALIFERLDGFDGLSCQGEYRLLLLSRRGDLSASDLLGQPVSVLVLLAPGGVREFNGLATGFSLLAPQGRLHRYQLLLRPWLWMLTCCSDCRLFQDQTTPQILQAVFAAHPYADFRFELTGHYLPRTYCVQYRETDYQFIARLLEQEGMHYFFAHRDGRHQLVIADSAAAHQPVPGYARVDFLEPDAQSGWQREGLQSWIGSAEIQSTRQVLRAHDFEKPRADLQVEGEAATPLEQEPARTLERYDYPGDYRERAAGERLARLQAEALRAQQETFSGEGNAAGLTPGARFRLQSHPRPDQNQDYLVTAVEYRLQEAGREPGERVDAWLNLKLSAIPAAQEYRPPVLTPRPRIQGPQTAVVTGPAGDEIHTDRYGRVKVRFHWDRLGRGDQDSSCWIRVAHPWAGQNWGMVAIPRVGQEVVVEFLEGDPDRPLITGSVYNADQLPPYALPQHMTQSGIRSRSTPGGNGSNYNEIRFEDQRGAEELRLHAERDQLLQTRRDRVESIGNESHLTVGQDLREQCGGDHHLRVGGDQNVALGGSHSFSVGQDWQGQVGLRLAAEAGREIHLKAGIKLVLEAGAQLTLKVGASFIEIGPGGVTLAGPSVNLHGGGMPGNGSGASPEPPLAPRTVAAPDAAVAASPAPSGTRRAASRQAQALRLARDSASALVEKCPD